MKRIYIFLLLICVCLFPVGCASTLGIGTFRENSAEKYGEWEAYQTAPSFLPEKIDEYTVNAYSYTLYNYFDTCYEIFLDITVSEAQFNELVDKAEQYSDTYIKTDAYYSEAYTEIVFTDVYEIGGINKHDDLQQVGWADIDKVIYNPESFNIIYVSFHANDTDVYDVENISYFNRFSITPEEYFENLTI